MSSTVETQNARTKFPIQTYWPENCWPRQRKSIPWELIQPHEAQALRNHCGQTLARLAERGGLDALEAVAVLADQTYHDRWGWSQSAEETRSRQLDAIRILGERVERFLSENGGNQPAAQDNQNPVGSGSQKLSQLLDRIEERARESQGYNFKDIVKIDLPAVTKALRKSIGYALGWRTPEVDRAIEAELAAILEDRADVGEQS